MAGSAFRAYGPLLHSVVLHSMVLQAAVAFVALVPVLPIFVLVASAVTFPDPHDVDVRVLRHSSNRPAYHDYLLKLNLDVVFLYPSSVQPQGDPIDLPMYLHWIFREVDPDEAG